MLQIDLLRERAREREVAMRTAAARRRSARGAAPVRVRLGGALIRLGRLVAGDRRQVPVWQS